MGLQAVIATVPRVDATGDGITHFLVFELVVDGQVVDGTHPVPVSQAASEAGSNSSAVLVSASRTATTNSADQDAGTARGLTLIVDVTDASAGGSITPALQIKDSISGHYLTVWTATQAVVANGTYGYLFRDGASGGAWTEVTAFGVPSETYRWVFTANNASALVYSASQEQLV